MANDNTDNKSTGTGFGTASDPPPTPAKEKSGPTKAAAKAAAKKKKKLKNPMAKAKNAESQIPKEVSNRMIRRVAIASGIPSTLAFVALPLSYYATEQGWVDLPAFVILLVSLGCLAVGLVGISYGVLSASWDEGREGSLAGVDEFKLNLGRIRETQKANRKSSS